MAPYFVPVAPFSAPAQKTHLHSAAIRTTYSKCTVVHCDSQGFGIMGPLPSGNLKNTTDLAAGNLLQFLVRRQSLHLSIARYSLIAKNHSTDCVCRIDFFLCSPFTSRENPLKPLAVSRAPRSTLWFQCRVL